MITLRALTVLHWTMHSQSVKPQPMVHTNAAGRADSQMLLISLPRSGTLELVHGENTTAGGEHHMRQDVQHEARSISRIRISYPQGHHTGLCAECHAD